MRSKDDPIYTLCDHISCYGGIGHHFNNSTKGNAVFPSEYACARGVKVELDAAGDLIVDIDPGTDYPAEKTSSQADTFRF
jgi:hypothetical protein